MNFSDSLNTLFQATGFSNKIDEPNDPKQLPKPILEPERENLQSEMDPNSLTLQS